MALSIFEFQEQQLMIDTKFLISPENLKVKIHFRN